MSTELSVGDVLVLLVLARQLERPDPACDLGLGGQKRAEAVGLGTQCGFLASLNQVMPGCLQKCVEREPLFAEATLSVYEPPTLAANLTCVAESDHVDTRCSSRRRAAGRKRPPVWLAGSA